MPSLKARLSIHDPVYGLFCSTPAALTVELVAAAGYDFVVIDLEHTLIGAEQLATMLMAARASGVSALVRVAAPHQVVQALDAGAEGIVFPRIRSAQAAQDAVCFCHFAPRGERGLNATWHSRFGRDDLSATLDTARKQTLVVVMIEDAEGLDQAHVIAAVDGVDVLLEGAADLSQSLGFPWQTRHPEVLTAVSRIRKAAQHHGKVFCALPRAPEDFQASYQDQVRMFILGDDRGIARRAMAAHLTQHQVRGAEQ
ncbi:HpcH/HpaI aldolase family protein [Candidatus Nitrotoga sp. M5]|uniref:HpcH/HpaI aldolase family protein n=1 Tax=Candidatus Nitrotoga sp. M5 TaxID=2890409 RepID=UPI001EF3C126|nr:aldolase/citrate lyase family protein [Candidatus Nitrotoga sp. M5]CAH1386614.1 4-hydroxy-2-oxoheptanedioate aldolase [Candidatus Nitrotoga sp. M5]